MSDVVVHVFIGSTTAGTTGGFQNQVFDNLQTVMDYSYMYLFIYLFSHKTDFDISCKSYPVLYNYHYFNTPIEIYTFYSTLKISHFLPNILICSHFPHKNVCCGYSLEASLRNASNKYPNYMFMWRNKKRYEP